LPLPTEHVEALRFMHIVRLHRLKYPALDNLLHVPNGGDRHGAVAAKMKGEGVSPGFPDYLLCWPSHGFHSLAIELKRQNYSPSHVKDNQRAWHERLREAGYRVEVAGGWEAAWNVVRDYLGITT
jgi:hypothetical protein